MRFFFSEEAYRIHNIDPENFQKSYNNILGLIHSEDRLNSEVALRKCLQGKPYRFNYRIPIKEGLERYVMAKGEPIFDKDGQVTGIIGIVQDITEKVELKKEIKLKEEETQKMQKTFQVLARESKDIFGIIDGDGTIKYSSESVEKMTNYSSKELVNKNLYSFFKGRELEKLKEMISFVLRNPSKGVERDIIYETMRGIKTYLEVNMQNMFNDPAIEGIIINLRDITRRIQMEKNMAHTATHDKLTDLPNSIFFSKKLRLQCEYARKNKTKFALLMLDIDGLRYVRYSLGREYEDRLILEIVRKLEDFLGDDTFISRYSEDHFAIIIQGINKFEDYEKLIRGLIKLLSKPHKLESYQLDTMVNIGICIFPTDGMDQDTFIRQSKLALFRAKREGQNTYKFYSPDIDIQSYKEFVLRSDLFKAIEKNQLRVFYQPIVSLKDSEILGAEALIRWKHPDWGMISPDVLIPLAEESGVIINIGKWVLRRACKDYKDWKEKGLPDIKVSVNFSSIEFLEKDFVVDIKSIIDEYQLDPKFLIMEITENILVENTNKINSDIKILQSYGIQVAIDDFGMEFSSLSYLSSLNTDIIKIDKSLIKGIPGDSINTSITRVIINLSKEIGVKLVVEGVENWQQLNYLRSLNCSTGQGYLFSKPVPLEDFERILVKKRCIPSMVCDTSIMPYQERRKFFRVKFIQLLEANLTIQKIKGKRINVGNTKTLIKDIGPGGLRFISNIKFPIMKDVILQFTMELLGKELKVYGSPVWINEIDYGLFEYGVKFTVDENERADLIMILNQAQIKMRRNELFAEGSFISGSYREYFYSLTNNH